MYVCRFRFRRSFFEWEMLAGERLFHPFRCFRCGAKFCSSREPNMMYRESKSTVLVVTTGPSARLKVGHKYLVVNGTLTTPQKKV